MSDARQAAIDERVQKITEAYRAAGGSCADITSGVVHADDPERFDGARVDPQRGALSMPASLNDAIENLYSRSALDAHDATLVRQQLATLAEGLARNGSEQPKTWGPGDTAMAYGAERAAAAEILDDFIDKLDLDPLVAADLHRAGSPTSEEASAVRAWADASFQDKETRREALQSIANRGGEPLAYADALLHAQRHRGADAQTGEQSGGRHPSLVVTDASYENLRSDLTQAMVTEFQQLPAHRWARSSDRVGRRAAQNASQVLAIHREVASEQKAQNHELADAYRAAAAAAQAYAENPAADHAVYKLGAAHGKVGYLEATIGGARGVHWDRELDSGLNDLDRLDQADTKLQKDLARRYGPKAEAPGRAFSDLEHEKKANADSRTALRKGHEAKMGQVKEMIDRAHTHTRFASTYRAPGAVGPTRDEARQLVERFKHLAAQTEAAPISTHLSDRPTGRWTEGAVSREPGTAVLASVPVETNLAADYDAHHSGHSVARFLSGVADPTNATKTPPSTAAGADSPVRPDKLRKQDDPNKTL